MFLVLALTAPALQEICNSTCRLVMPNCLEYFVSGTEYTCQACDSHWTPSLRTYDPSILNVTNGLPTIKLDGMCLGYQAGSDPLLQNCTLYGKSINRTTNATNSIKCLQCIEGQEPLPDSVSWEEDRSEPWVLCQKAAGKEAWVLTAVGFLITAAVTHFIL